MKDPKGSTLTQRFPDKLECAGNELPDPAMIFCHHAGADLAYRSACKRVIRRE